MTLKNEWDGGRLIAVKKVISGLSRPGANAGNTLVLFAVIRVLLSFPSGFNTN